MTKAEQQKLLNRPIRAYILAGKKTMKLEGKGEIILEAAGPEGFIEIFYHADGSGHINIMNKKSNCASIDFSDATFKNLKPDDMDAIMIGDTSRPKEVD